MMRVTNISRHTFTITALLVFLICSPTAVAKHIIVIYDVSGSMIRLRTNDGIKTYMKSEDIRRVNDYLTDILFTDTSQLPRDPDDSQIKECESAYVGRPLYQSGDSLTYAEYAKQQSTKINKAPVHREEFQRELPDPMNLSGSFYGQVSYLLRAEKEVYDTFYNETDDETYWIFVTDGDIDNSGKSDPGIASVLKRLAEIEEEYYAPRIFSIFVNNHVKIEVRRLEKRDRIKSIFIATPTKPTEPVQQVQLSRDNEGQFISETLTIDTKNSAKSKFKLNNVNVEIVDKYNKPLQVANKNDGSSVLEVAPVSLHGNPPPYEFRIPFPTNPEIAAPDNALKLEVTYSYDGIDQDPYSAPLTKYTAVIDSIYVANPDDPDRQAQHLTLHFSEGTYQDDLTIQSESPNKKAFQINQVHCYIQYKDGRELCDANVSSTEVGLGEVFWVKVPDVDRLDWYGNKLVLDIAYQYNALDKSETIEIPFKLRESGFPMWLLILLLVPLCVVGYFLVRWIIQQFDTDPIGHQIKVAEVSAVGTLIKEGDFTLQEGAFLEFGPGDDDRLRFDVGSSAFLYCIEDDIKLFADANEDGGRILEPTETLVLKRGEDDEVIIHFEIVNDDSDGPIDDGLFPSNKDEGSDASPLHN